MLIGAGDGGARQNKQFYSTVLGFHHITDGGEADDPTLGCERENYTERIYFVDVFSEPGAELIPFWTSHHGGGGGNVAGGDSGSVRRETVKRGAGSGSIRWPATGLHNFSSINVIFLF